MASSFLQRVEVLEQQMGPRVCQGSCLKCELARMRCLAEGKAWSGCNGFPLNLTEILLGLEARANGELLAPARRN